MQPPRIKLFELAPTRSARCRWALLEAGLQYESVGNTPDIIWSEELRQVHPLGKLPAAVIDGRPLFESAAIVAAVADLVPDKHLIAAPGTWSRVLHDQWVFYALTEMEPWVTSIELNTDEFVLPKDQHIPAILPQSAGLFKKGAQGLEKQLTEHEYLVEDRFTAADIIVGYTVCFGEELGLLDEFKSLRAYLERLRQREHCTLPEHGA